MKDAIVCVGAVNIDIQGFASEKLVMEDCNSGRMNLVLGGVARNIAEAIARLQAPVELVSAVGKDAFGNWLLEDCDKLGIGRGMIIQREYAPTATYVNLVEADGGFFLGLSDMQTIENISKTDLMPFEKQLRSASCLVVDCCLKAEVIEWLLGLNAHVWLDPVSAGRARRVESMLGSFYGVKLNSMECETLTGIALLSEGSVKKAADVLHAKGIREVILTRGDQSAFYSDGTISGFESVIPMKRINPSGAGDTLLGVYLACRHRELSAMESFRRAMLAASLSVNTEDTVNKKIRWELLDNLYHQYYG